MRFPCMLNVPAMLAELVFAKLRLLLDYVTCNRPISGPEYPVPHTLCFLIMLQPTLNLISRYG